MNVVANSVAECETKHNIIIYSMVDVTIYFKINILLIDGIFTLLNLSGGMSCNMIGSIVVTLPNRTSGI